MIAKIVKGKGFRGLVEYLHKSPDGNERGQLLAGNLAGRSPREWAKQFGLMRKLRPTLGKAVFHASLSPSPDDPSLTDEQYVRIARKFLDGMGFTNETPFLVIRHDDQSLPHIHIAASRIMPDGKVVSDARDFQRAEAIMREIEQGHGLVPVMPSKVQQVKNKRHKRRDKTMNNIIGNEEQTQTAEPEELTGAEVAEIWNDEQRREARRQMLDEKYKDMLRQSFGDEVAFIRVNRKRPSLYVSFKDGASLYDDGDHMRIVGGDNDLAARRIVAAAIAKHWTAISFSGNREFVMEAMRMAMQYGLQVIPKNPDQAAMLEEVMKERSNMGGSESVTPSPTPVQSPTPKPAPRIDMSKLANLRSSKVANSPKGRRIGKR